MTSYNPTQMSKVKRAHERASYDHESVHAILDAAPLCHVGYTIDGQPYVTPTIHWREGTTLYWHGSSASRMLRTVRDSVPVCLTATLFDGFVMARSAFHHSANYRCVMAYGKAEMISEDAEKLAALKSMFDKFWPERWEELRPVSAKEMKATMVVKMEITEASAKVRTGPPVDDAEDYDDNVWAGVLPVSHDTKNPIPDTQLKKGIQLPSYLE